MITDEDIDLILSKGRKFTEEEVIFSNVFVFGFLEDVNCLPNFVPGGKIEVKYDKQPVEFLS